MKKITFLLLTALPFLGFAQLSNGSFDTDLTDWQGQNSPTSFTHDAADGNLANGSASFTTAAVNNSGMRTVNFQVANTADYLLRFYVKGTAGDQVRGDVFETNGDGFQGGSVYTIQATGVWEEYTTTLTSIEGLSNINVRVLGRTPSASYLIDDVEFNELLSEDSWVTNPDFENTTTGTINAWTASGAEVDLFTETTNVNSGATAARVEFNTAQTSNQNFDNDRFVFAEDKAPTEFSITFDALPLQVGDEVQAVIRVYDAAGTFIGSDFTARYTLTDNVAFETVNLTTANSNGTFREIQLRLRVHQNSAAAPGDYVIFDNVQGSFVYESLSVPSVSAERGTFKLFPNPAKDQVNFVGQNTISTVSIFDITGKKVLTSQNVMNNTLNVSTLNSGVYLVNITDSKNNRTTKKLVIK